MAVNKILTGKNNQLLILFILITSLFGGLLLIRYEQLLRRRADDNQVNLIISPEIIDLQVGEVQTVNIYLNLASFRTVYFSTEIHYPSDLVMIEDINYDPEKKFGIKIDEITNLNEVQGKVNIGLRSLFPVSGNVRVATIRFRGVNPGEKSIDINRAAVTNYDNSTWLLVDRRHGQIRVLTEPTGPLHLTPTTTRAPILTATPVPTGSLTITPWPTTTPRLTTTPMPTNTVRPGEPTSTPTPTETVILTPTPTIEPAVINFKVKMVGTEYMVDDQKIVVDDIPDLPFDITIKNDTNYYQEEGVMVEFDEKAIGTGRIETTEIPEGFYLISVKGPNHLARRYCYHDQDRYCQLGNNNILITRGDNDIDFTGWPVEPGDINQDGVVDVLDFSILKQSLGEKGYHKADINFNGVVNTQDISIFLRTLDSRYEDEI